MAQQQVDPYFSSFNCLVEYSVIDYRAVDNLLGISVTKNLCLVVVAFATESFLDLSYV
jgi:hypothetical protein